MISIYREGFIGYSPYSKVQKQDTIFTRWIKDDFWINEVTEEGQGISRQVDIATYAYFRSYRNDFAY